MGRSPDDKSILEVLLTETALRLKAGSAYFERGRRYATTRQVKQLKVTSSALSAVVTGTSRYRVRIWVEEGSLSHSCSCPVGDGGEFCKHCVASGLVWLNAVKTTQDWPEEDQSAVDLRAYLSTQTKEALVELLMERVAANELFAGKVTLEAAKAAAVPADLEAYKQAIDAAIVVDDFVDYRSMYDYSHNATTVIRSIEAMLEVGHAHEVIELSAYALECVEEAMGRVDDSDGCMGEMTGELMELHHRACLAAPPDPEQLATRLFDWAIHSEWEMFLDGAARYADVLGDIGLTHYRSLAEQVWDQVPIRQSHDDRIGSSSNFAITYIMETLAKISGSVDEQIAIKTRDLTYAYHYVQIIELLAGAGRTDDALIWAERGLVAFPHGTDVRLRDAAARELHRAGRDDEAMTIVWAEFEENPGSSSYEFLYRHAVAIGQWSEWRDRAVGLMRQRESHTRAVRSKSGAMSSARGDVFARPFLHGYDEQPESSELVKVFLWENDIESAWEQAGSGGCSPRLWLQLADLRQGEHPADAIPIYQEEIERKLGAKNNRAYQEGVDMMIRVRALMARAEREVEFPAYAAQVRASHRAKRNLMKLFDGEGW